MLRIFLNNVPFQFEPRNKMSFFNGKLVEKLHNKIARIAKCDSEAVKFFLSFQDQPELMNNGKVEYTQGVRGTVIWFGAENRNEVIKQLIANALQHFLNQHSIGKDFDLTFMDMPAGSFYIEQGGKSVMVPGGEPTIPLSVMGNIAYDHTGWKAPGFEPECPQDPDDVF